MTGSATSEGISISCSFDGEFFRAGDTHTISFTATNNSTVAMQGLCVTILSNENASITKTVGPVSAPIAVGSTINSSIDIGVGQDFADVSSVTVRFIFQYPIATGVYSMITLTPFSSVPIFSQQAAMPAISKFTIYRCNASGVRQDEGLYARIQVQGETSAAYSLTVANHALRIGHRIYGSDASYTYTSLSLGTSTISIDSTLSGTFSAGNRYEFVCEFSNTYATARSYAELGKAFANLHLAGSGYGVAIGQYSTATEAQPKFECQYPAYFYGGILEGVPKVDYSTTETDTGSKWIDGKPIYRKTLVYTSTSAVSSDSITHGIENADMIWLDAGGSFFASTSNNFYYPPGYVMSSGSRAFSIAPSRNGSTIALVTSSGGTSYITFMYTKTTD